MTASVLHRIVRRLAPPASASQSRARQPGWIDQLAAWADRQPRHHHLGRWTAI